MDIGYDDSIQKLLRQEAGLCYNKEVVFRSKK